MGKTLTAVPGNHLPGEPPELARTAAVVGNIQDDLVPRFQDHPQWQAELTRCQDYLTPLFKGVTADNAERLLRRALPETVIPKPEPGKYETYPFFHLVKILGKVTEDIRTPAERIQTMAQVTDRYTDIMRSTPQEDRYSMAYRIDTALHYNRYYKKTLEGLSDMRDAAVAVAGRGGSINAAVELVAQIPKEQAIELAVEYNPSVATSIPRLAMELKRVQDGSYSEPTMAEFRSVGAMLNDGIQKLHLGGSPEDDYEIARAVGCEADILGKFIQGVRPFPVSANEGIPQPGNPLLSRGNVATTVDILLSSSPETNLFPLEKSHGGYYGSTPHVHMVSYYLAAVVGAVNELGVTNHQQLAEVCKAASEDVQMRDDEVANALNGDLSAYHQDMIPFMNPTRQFLSEALKITPYTQLPLEFRGSRDAQAKLADAGVNASTSKLVASRFDEQTIFAVAEAYPTIQGICASRRADGQPSREDLEGFARIMHNARERAGDDAIKLFNATIGAMPPEHPLLDIGRDVGNQMRETTAQTLFDATQPLIVGGLLVEGDVFRDIFQEGMTLINVRTFAPPKSLEEVQQLAAGVVKSIVEARESRVESIAHEPAYRLR
ncbi:Uncharacterised protein [uncultured archaeon]|nr:Uncharacterised protein [uncultured archaeon]